MRETLAMCGFAAVPGIVLVIHRKGLVHSVRCVGNVFYATAWAVEHFRAEFARLNQKSREMK